jgi:hypothetical protein
MARLGSLRVTPGGLLQAAGITLIAGSIVTLTGRLVFGPAEQEHRKYSELQTKAEVVEDLIKANPQVKLVSPYSGDMKTIKESYEAEHKTDVYFGIYGSAVGVLGLGLKEIGRRVSRNQARDHSFR